MAVAPSHLRMAHVLRGCGALGPGLRTVVWVAGCTRRCPGCVADSILGATAGVAVHIDVLVEYLVRDGEMEGITLTGGEPFEQAGVLARLVATLRSRKDLSVMAYSGFTLSELHSKPEASDLLVQLDVLVDGPFQAAEQADLLWRGSRNQRVHLLTHRHADLAPLLESAPGVGVEVRVDPDRQLFWAGVPGPGFVAALRRGLAAHGVQVRDIPGMWS